MHVSEDLLQNLDLSLFNQKLIKIMSDSKVYMFPESDRGTDTALLASTLANQNNGMNSAWPMMAMANGGLGGQWNNP